MYFDIAMPLTLSMVVAVVMFLEGKVEKKLKTTLEEKEFGVRDAVLLVVGISVTVSLMVFIPQMAIMVIFLFVYSMLLFVFTYFFSDFTENGARMFCLTFLVISFLAATTSLISFGANSTVAYGALAFYCLFGFAFLALLYEKNRTGTGERWYLALLPPALFICLYLFFSRTPIWFPYLLDLYGVIFAVLITLYLGSLFTWKTSLIFVGLLTVMDIILVLFTGSMVSAARHVSSLQLPMLVVVRTFPAVVINGGLVWMSLGLGDFFFAGLLAIQTLKKFGKSLAFASIIAMSASFFIFEALMLNYEPRAFPGTLMIICGWAPLVLWKGLKKSRKRIHLNFLVHDFS
jgi:presenilin-like A22 family membrane protease